MYPGRLYTIWMLFSSFYFRILRMKIIWANVIIQKSLKLQLNDWLARDEQRGTSCPSIKLFETSFPMTSRCGNDGVKALDVVRLIKLFYKMLYCIRLLLRVSLCCDKDILVYHRVWKDHIYSKQPMAYEDVQIKCSQLPHSLKWT